MFQNTGKINFGKQQGTNIEINNVVLPPWAENAQFFVHLMAQALESEYVNEFLAEWINLVFGVN